MRLRAWLVVLPLALPAAGCRLGYDLVPGERAPGAGGSGGSSNAGASGAEALGGARDSGGMGAAPTSAGAGSTGLGGADDAGGAGAGGAGAGGEAAVCASEQDLTSNVSPSAPPPVNCSYPGALICDDFESGQLPHWRVWLAAPARATVQDCTVHGGQSALFVHPVAPDQAQISQPLQPAVGSGSLFIRSFVYLPSGQLLPPWTVLFEVWDSPTSYTDKLSLDLQADGSLATSNFSATGGQTSSVSTGAVKLPLDEWVCLELDVAVDKINGAMRIYLNDGEVAASAGPMRTRGNRDFNTVVQGAVVAEGSLRVYVDDFVVATQRVGCD